MICLKFWIAIDPKGVIGEAEYEMFPLDFFTDYELKNADNLPDLFNQRIQILADKSGLNLERLKKWCFVRLALAIAWCIEDNISAEKWLRLYNIFQQSLSC